MKTTQEFKVGDIVRFKSDPESQRFASAWNMPKFGLKIASIRKVNWDDSSLVTFEGMAVTRDSLASRLEKQPNLFAFGKKNPKIKKLFLEYLKGNKSTGLCYFTERKSLKAYDFLRLQPVFEKEDGYPVEYFVLRSMKKSTEDKIRRYDTQYENRSYNDPSTPEGRLRIWWATNLAIAASQGKI